MLIINMFENIPLPTIRRLPVYVSLLKEFIKSSGKEYISTTDFCKKLELKPIQVRKDLSFTGAIGKPKIGYNAEELLSTLLNFLSWNNKKNAILIGAGALGSALIGYQGFKKYGINIKAVFDNDKTKINTEIRHAKVQSIDNMKSYIEQNKICIAILTVPKEYAQEITDILISSNIKGIWNFSATKLITPENIYVQHEDLAAGLAVLSVNIANMAEQE